MSIKPVIRIVLLTFVVASVALLVAREWGFDALRDEKAPAPARGSTAAMTSSQVAEDAYDGVVLYYFHGDRRCRTCRTIEKYLEESAATFFPEELAAGTLRWRPVNVEESQNRRFVTEFGFDSRSAVIAEMKGDAVERATKLDLVWQLVRDKPAFMEYVRGETAEFLGKGRGDE